MGSYRDVWDPMGFCGVLWGHKAIGLLRLDLTSKAIGFNYNPTALPSLWGPVGLYGVPVGFYGVLWGCIGCVGPCGAVWGPYGAVGGPVGMYRDLGGCMGCTVDVWGLMGVYGVL